VPRRRNRALPWMVVMVVAIAMAVSPAMANELDSPSSVPVGGTTVEGDASAGGQPPEPANPSQPERIEAANEEILLETVQSAGAARAEGLQFSRQTGDLEIEEYDPWEPFNEKMFSFNHDVFDRFLLKPVATAWNKVVPDWLQDSLGNAIDNLGMPRRVVNNLLQAKFKGAGLELVRFFINSTFGIAGLFDIAKDSGLEERDEDTGQTLGAYGVGPGPYLILPFLPPLTVRDGIGYIGDLALDPLNYVLPLAASLGRRGGETVNTRSENLEFFESVEETTVDLYSAVRNAYLQRRQRAIEE